MTTNKKNVASSQKSRPYFRFLSVSLGLSRKVAWRWSFLGFFLSLGGGACPASCVSGSSPIRVLLGVTPRGRGRGSTASAWTLFLACATARVRAQRGGAPAQRRLGCLRAAGRAERVVPDDDGPLPAACGTSLRRLGRLGQCAATASRTAPQRRNDDRLSPNRNDTTAPVPVRSSSTGADPLRTPRRRVARPLQ